MSGEEQKHWTEHLGELRTRILITLATFIIMLFVGFLFAQPMIHFMKEDLFKGLFNETLKLAYLFSG